MVDNDGPVVRRCNIIAWHANSEAVSANRDDDDNNDWESEVEMTPLNGSNASGDIDFELDEGQRSFEASFEDLTPGQYDLIVDGVIVETITIPEGDDQYDVEYDDEDSDIAFPSNFPTLSAGSTIELEGILSGQL